MVLAVKFQNWVSFAEAPTGINASMQAIRAVALTISRGSPIIFGFRHPVTGQALSRAACQRKWSSMKVETK